MMNYDQIGLPQLIWEDIMKASKLLHKQLRTACPNMHKVRLKALFAGINSALTYQQVTVTGLGRNLKSYSKTSTKHDIKRMDRLIGNEHLYQERDAIYHYLLTQLIGNQKHPILIADWSPIPGNEIFQLLRISIPMGGRSLTVYEKCYQESQLNNTDVHNEFLDTLEDLLPSGCQPIILSDAIFKTPWFLKIESKGWYWTGRVRGNIQLSLDDGLTYQGCTQIMKQAKRKPTSLGDVRYSKVNQFKCHAVLYHGTLKGKHKIKKRGGYSKDGKSLYYSRKAKQPWLLISSLPTNMNTPKKVVKLYRYRMQIEEGFRDTKNQQYGLGLAQAKSTTTERYNNLLLIATLALFIMWCIGKAAHNKGYHFHIQANTVRHYTVLSLIYLAMQVINDRRYKIKKKELRMIFEDMTSYTQNCHELANKKFVGI